MGLSLLRSGRNDNEREKLVIMRFKIFFLLFAILAIVTGCRATLSVDFDRTPTPNVAPQATIEALQADVSQLATRVAAQVTPTPPPPPDMGKLAYVQGGDIYVKDIPDGKPERLTTDGRNREPRWSPSGEWIAFRKDREVILRRQVSCDLPKPSTENCYESESVLQQQFWVMRADGSAARSLNQGLSVDAFAWAPTGDRVAYITAAGELQAVNADSANPVVLISPYNFNGVTSQLGQMAWNPDGTWIAYEWRTQGPDQKVTYQGLWKISTDGRERIELFNSGAPKKAQAVLAGWAPSGRSLLFWQSDSPQAALADGAPLYAIGVDGLNKPESAVKKGSDVILPDPDFIAPLPLSAARGQDVFALVVGGGRRTWTNKRLDVGGLLTSPDYAVISPAWSPDGTRLASSAMPARNDIAIGDAAVQELMLRHIWVMDYADQKDPQQLTNGSSYRDERPLWSADSNYILFVRMDFHGRTSLWMVPVATGAAFPVADELTPAPDPFGQDGLVDWGALYDWWRGPGRYNQTRRVSKPLRV